MPCVTYTQSSTSTFCDSCAELEYRELIRRFCRRTTSTNPVEMAQTVMAHPRFPVAGQAHHSFVAGLLVAAYRNAGGDAGDAEIECAFSAANKLCNEADCKFYPATPPPRIAPRLAVLG